MVAAFWAASTGLVMSQHTDSLVQLNISQARERLLKENLLLLAQEFEISNAEANVIQSKLWNNVTLIWNSDLYSVERNDYFNIQNQRLFQIEMMVPAIGKRIKAVKLAQIGVEKSRLEFEILLQELMWEMETTYHTLACNRKNGELLEQMVGIFENLILASEKQLEVGAISGSEFIRLKSELLSLKTQLSDNSIESYELESKLRVLLNVDVNQSVDLLDSLAPSSTLYTYEELLATAIQYRPDYHLSEVQIAYNEQDLRLQRTSAFGDVKVGYQPHDKGSNYVRPYSGLVLEVPLPIFNRNQGNIAAAKNRIEQAKVMMVQKENEMQSDIMSAYLCMVNLQNLNSGFDAVYLESLDQLQQGASENFAKRSISILEYIDFQRIYLQTLLDYHTLQANYKNSMANLNLLVGKPLY